MTARPNIYTKNYPIVNAWIAFGQKVQASGLEESLVHLVEIRSSQINGCVVCLDMHSKDALKSGESVERIIMLDAWRESKLYTPREKAALAWTEALVRLADTQAPDDVYDEVKAHFTEEEQVNLTLMIGVINTFNKLGVGFRVPPIAEHRKAA
jgi:AhpD family alkylhydroperoxidase